MQEPEWLTTDDVIQIHNDVVRIQGSSGFPHPGYLESAVIAPQQTLHYSHGGLDLYDLAAVYLYHIAKAHAFTDANKRTAYGSALVFLGINDINLMLPPNMLSLARATIAVAKDEIDKVAIAALLREMPRRTDA